MREHLYKGFHPDLKGVEEITLNGKKIKGIWVKGFLFKIQGECSVLTCIGCEPLSANDYSEILGDWYDVIPETVCEFTGLYDNTKWEDLSTEQQAAFLYPAYGGRNKKEDWKGISIFEGDIVNVYTRPHDISSCYRGKNLIIKFDEYHRFVASGNLEYPLCSHYIWKFIGNRFSNPELLNK